MTRTRLWRSCGLLGAAAFLVLYVVAMSLDSHYVLGENYLSDLGVSEGAWAFNSGLILAGLLMMPFAVRGIGPELGRGLVGMVGTVLLLVSALLLISIGIFTEDAGEIHGIVSVAFFLETLVTVGVIDLGLFRSKTLGLFGPVVSTACFVFGICLLPFGGTPLVETLAVFDIILWGILISGRLAIKG
jgi:hypothetical membrane protein